MEARDKPCLWRGELKSNYLAHWTLRMVETAVGHSFRTYMRHGSFCWMIVDGQFKLYALMIYAIRIIFLWLSLI